MAICSLSKTVHLIICIFRSDITSCSYSYCQHLPVQNNVSEQLVRGDTGPIFTAFVFFLIAHINANITYAPVGTICICWSIWIGVLAVSYQLLGIIQSSPTIAQDISRRRSRWLLLSDSMNVCQEKVPTLDFAFQRKRLWGRIIFWVIFKPLSIGTELSGEGKISLTLTNCD